MHPCQTTSHPGNCNRSYLSPTVCNASPFVTPDGWIGEPPGAHHVALHMSRFAGERCTRTTSVFPDPFDALQGTAACPTHNACSFLRQWHTLSCTCTATYSSLGAGPAGLSLAISLAKAGFTATVLDQNPTATLEQPAPTAARSRSPTQRGRLAAPGFVGEPGRQRDGAHPRRPCARRARSTQ